MRLEEPIVANGLFWFPGDPDRKVSGTLRVSENGEATLEMMDSHLSAFRGMNDIDDPIRILGITNQSGVTLDECGFTSWNLGGLPQTTIRVGVVYWRVHYEEGDDIAFSKVEFSVEHLNKWLHTQPMRSLEMSDDGGEQSVAYSSGMSYRWSRNEGMSVEYAPPKDVLIKLLNGMEMRLCFSYRASSGAFESNITATPYISLESQTERHIDEFHSLVHKICAFLSFSVDRAVALESMTGYSKELIGYRGDPTKQVPVEVYFDMSGSSLPQSELRISDIFLPYQTVEGQIDAILNRWLESYQIDEFEPSINLYSAILSQPDIYLDVKFLFFAQSLEVLHRRVSDETVMSDEEFRCIRSAMLEAVPEKWKDHFCGRLNHANEPSLRRRLRMLLKDFSELYCINSKGRESFANKVVITRNYLTHYDKSLKSEAADDQGLFDLTRKLKSLLQLHFLQLIGLDKQTIAEITRRNPSYHHRMMRLWEK